MTQKAKSRIRVVSNVTNVKPRKGKVHKRKFLLKNHISEPDELETLISWLR